MRGKNIGRYGNLEDERSDEQIMAAYAGGEDEAFSEIFRRYAQRLFGYLYHMSRDRELAQDLVQETFVRVHRARERYDPSRPLKPWVFRIATNVQADQAKSWFSKLARRTRRLFEQEEDMAVAATPRPERATERAMLAVQLRSEIAQLKEPYRQAILLHDLEGLNCRETAEALGKPVGTVLSLLRRGRGLLRARLAGTGGKAAWS